MTIHFFYLIPPFWGMCGRPGARGRSHKTEADSLPGFTDNLQIERDQYRWRSPERHLDPPHLGRG